MIPPRFPPSPGRLFSEPTYSGRSWKAGGTVVRVVDGDWSLVLSSPVLEHRLWPATSQRLREGHEGRGGERGETGR